MQNAAKQLQQLQQQLMYQQAEMGAKRADVQVDDAKLCCALLFSAVLCCAVLCCAVLCCSALCCAVLRCAVPCCAALCCAVLCCAALRCAGLDCLLHQTVSATLRLEVAVYGDCLGTSRWPKTSCQCCRQQEAAMRSTSV